MLINKQTLHTIILDTMACEDIEYDYLLRMNLLEHILEINKLLSDLFSIHVVHFYDVFFTHIVLTLEKILCIVAVTFRERNIYVGLFKHSVKWSIRVILKIEDQNEISTYIHRSKPSLWSSFQKAACIGVNQPDS